MRILHLDTEKTWRGGENQVKALIEGLHEKVEKQFAAAPFNSVAIKENRWSCEALELKSGNPYDPRIIYQLVQFINKNKIQLIDAHTAKAHTLAVHVAFFLPDLKIVVHRRVDNVPKKNWLTKFKYFSPKVTCYVAISQAIAEILIQYGISPAKIKVVRSAVSDEVYRNLNRKEIQKQFRIKHQIPQKFLIFGNASALSNQKGYPTLIQAIAILKKTHTTFKVFIAGAGELKEELAGLVNELGLQNEIHFLGFLKDVPEFLSSLDVLVVPSNNEGLGTVILDGILAGCCPVGSRVGGIPEIIQHEQTGLLIEKGDSVRLARHLALLIDQPEKLQTLAENAKQHVLIEFSLESMIQGNLNVYNSLLN
jgi:glycosyltransferase involved in cell wall biosynthesis